MISAKCPNVFCYSKIPSLSIHVFSRPVCDNNFRFFIKFIQVALFVSGIIRDFAFNDNKKGIINSSWRLYFLSLTVISINFLLRPKKCKICLIFYAEDCIMTV